jgi:hypothetical protein
MKKYLTIIASAALLAACSNDADVVDNGQPTGKAIAFNMSLAANGAQTRAANEINDDAALQTKEFGVFAAYTGHLKYEQTTVSCDYMYNQKVEYKDGKWQYFPVKYWPNDARDYVSFYAYAPYVSKFATEDEGGIVDMSKNYDLGDPWINFRLPSRPWDIDNTDAGKANQIDLLYMQHLVGGTGTADDPYKYTAWDDQQNPQKVDSVMEFNFVHALACIGDTVKVSLSESLEQYIKDYCDIKLDSITIVYRNLTTKARLVLRTDNAVANWKEIISGELTTTRTFGKKFASIKLTSEAQKICEGTGLFYIPLQIRGTEAAVADVKVHYTIKVADGKKMMLHGDQYEYDDVEGSEYKGVAEGQFELDNNLEGQKQNINIVLHQKHFDLLHLSFDLADENDDPADNPSYSRKNK